MKSPTEQLSLASLDQNLLAEVRALRDRVQIQHGLVELLLERLRSSSRERHLEALEVNDPLPVHPLRGDHVSDENGSADADEVAEPESGFENVYSRRGTTWWPMPENAIQALRPNPGWEFCGVGSSPNVIGFSLCGMNIEEIEKAVELVSSAQRQKPTFVPIFLTDCPDLGVFRRHGYVAEYLPDPAIGAEQLVRRPYDRGRLIERKWNISRVLEFNQAMREAALESDWIMNDGPRLEFQSTAETPSRAKGPATRRPRAKKPQPRKSRRRKKTER